MPSVSKKLLFHAKCSFWLYARFLKKVPKFLNWRQKGSFRISQSVPFIFAPPEHADAMQCTIFSLYCIYECDTELPAINVVLIKCTHLFLNSGQNCPNMLYIHMCKNSAATTGSGAWCGSGNFLYFLCPLYFDSLLEPERIAAPEPYVNLFAPQCGAGTRNENVKI
jgi:hypothetical protein